VYKKLLLLAIPCSIYCWKCSHRSCFETQSFKVSSLQMLLLASCLRSDVSVLYGCVNRSCYFCGKFPLSVSTYSLFTCCVEHSGQCHIAFSAIHVVFPGFFYIGIHTACSMRQLYIIHIVILIFFMPVNWELEIFLPEITLQHCIVTVYCSWLISAQLC